MEGLAPTYILLSEIIQGLENGKTIFYIINKYCAENNTDFSRKLAFLIKNHHDQEKLNEVIHEETKKYRKQILFLISRSSNGVPILGFLKDLEKEVVASCELEIDEFINSLPFKMMVPIFLFQFPALLLLILYPFFQYLGENLS